MRFKLRDIVIFLAGAEFFHTLGHVFMVYAITFPMETKFMVMTAEMNTWAIFINGVLTILLLWWAKRLS